MLAQVEVGHRRQQIAEALARLRGLKYARTNLDTLPISHCRGIGPIEGTEIRALCCTQTRDLHNCRGIGPIEGTEIGTQPGTGDGSSIIIAEALARLRVLKYSHTFRCSQEMQPLQRHWPD